MDTTNTSEQEKKQPAASGPDFKPTVVGIGASAGGLSALKRLFELIPSDSGLVFVVVVHLAPEHKSLLPDLLQPSVRFPVKQVTETVALEPNHVYVIPPNANLSAIDTHLRLSKLEELRRERAPIDHFFRTLASTHDGHSIGVILTGTGSDGTLGLREIKAKGGLILVQDPNDAEFDGMPQSAIATGLVDRILTIAQISESLLRLAQVGPRIELVKNEQESKQQERVLLPKVLAILKARTDRDFSRYKPATILRRIARRMHLNYIEEFESYLEKLRETPDEARALADDLLITVTSFFRDPEVFQKLERDVVPQLFEGKGPNDNLRVWSVGCATGEEAYSVAMLLLEEASRRDAPPKIQLFASDLHKRSLDGAREGVYSVDIETDVSAERLTRFFYKQDGGYRIGKEVRETVIFAPHNLLGDPPFSRLDLITCRNLLIYLDRSVQGDVIDLFHYALCPNGHLLLGSAETIDAPELFLTEDKKLCFYRKRNGPTPEPRLPVFPLTRTRIEGDPSIRSEGRSINIPPNQLHQNLLERYAPPSILISPDNKLAHLSEHAGRYLMHPGGEVTVSVLRLVRDELRIELQSLLQASREGKELLDSKPIPVRFDGITAPVVMHVRPAQDLEQHGFVLVIFEEHPPQPEGGAPDQAIAGVMGANGQSAPRFSELEQELSTAGQRLQCVIEEYETSQEEMRASNEEMQSTNEELRSTMEELETSKEELQSINEELQAVNQENRHKVDELSQLSSDLQNLLFATDIATLFLDRDLKILRFTPRVAELFNVRVTDRGRAISDLTHRLGYEQLREDAQAVLNRLIPVQREIRDDGGRWYLTRVLPYRSTDDRIEGVVITFIEISTQKQSEIALRDSEEKYRGLFNSMDQGYCIIQMLYDGKGKANDWRYLEVNPAFQKHSGLDNASGKTIRELAPGIDQKWMEIYGGVAETGESIRLEDNAASFEGRAFDLYATRVGKAEERKVAVVFHDTTERRRREANTDLLALLGEDLSLLSAPGEIMKSVGERVSGFFHVSGCVFTDVNDERGKLDSTYAWTESDITGLEPSFRLEETCSEEFKRAGRIGETFIVRDTARDERADRHRLASLRIGSFVVVPFHSGGEWTAYFSVLDTHPRNWREDEIGLLQEICFRVYSRLERARAEEALRESEQRFRTLANTAAAFIWQNDAEGGNLFANEYFLDYCGKAPEELQGRGWHALVHPEDAATYIENYMAAVRERRSWHCRNRLRHRNGEWHWFANYAQPLFAQDGRYMGHVGVSVDVTEGEEAQIALQESQTRLVAIIEALPVGVAVTDNDGSLILSNREMKRYMPTGILPSRDEARAARWRSWDHDGSILQREDFPGARALRGQSTAGLEMVYTQDNGTEVWTQVASVPIRDSAARIVGVVNVVTDVTLLKLAQQARQSGEEQLRMVLEGIPQLVWRASGNGQWTWVSPQWMRFTGFNQKESVGDEWLNAVHPHDRELIRSTWAQAALQGLLDVEYRIRRASDGAYLWHRTRAVPVCNEQGQTVEWLGTSTDIEQLKQAEAARLEAEEKFRLFVENVREYALVQTNPEGQITSWNPGAERLFGFVPEQMLGQDFSVLLTPEDQAGGLFARELAKVTGGQRDEDARWFVRQDGSRFWARWITEPMKDETGRFRGLAKIMRDETEREHSDAFTRHSLSEKEELLKEVHHRVKNNLQVITSLLNMQTSQSVDARVIALFQETRNRVLAISSIHELLYRSESFANIVLADYTRQLAIGLVRFYGLEDRVHVEMSGSRATLELERAVPYGMLLNELVSNACKHAFPGVQTGTIRISIVPQDDAIVLTVADTGRGLPDQFDYEKASSLGLKLVHGLVRQLRGTFEIYSQSGTSVRIQFPATGTGQDE